MIQQYLIRQLARSSHILIGIADDNRKTRNSRRSTITETLSYFRNQYCSWGSKQRFPIITFMRDILGMIRLDAGWNNLIFVLWKSRTFIWYNNCVGMRWVCFSNFLCTWVQLVFGTFTHYMLSCYFIELLVFELQQTQQSKEGCNMGRLCLLLALDWCAENAVYIFPRVQIRPLRALAK